MLVDYNKFDEWTKKKSEFRIPGLDDTRVRERHALVIPGIIYLGLSVWFFGVAIAMIK